MKPYTLEWWIEQLHEAFFRAECVYLDRRANVSKYGIMVSDDPLAVRYQKYQELITFIEQRIITKYGEK